MISDFETNSIYFSERLQSDERYGVAFQRISTVLDERKIPYKLLPHTRDIWARDYMPIQIADGKFVEYRYDPDYLQGSSGKQNFRHLKTYSNIVCDAIGLKTIKSDIILDGGNVVKSQNSIILTDKIIWENRMLYSEKRLISQLHEIFETENVIMIPADDKCTFGHADGMLRFINNDTVLLSGFYEKADISFRNRVLHAIEKSRLNIEWLRCEKKEKEDNIAYINFLQTKDILLVPALGNETDEIAFTAISAFFPDYSLSGKIHQIDVREITKESGALNCVSWTIKE